ncbi:MAG TPA: hypothetical protein VG536_16690 [Pseudomonas sp.]|nr:hypothetical protein [Pseudomonas sp.]
MRTLHALIAASMLLSGCSFTGTYPDATEPDAAKLRFISTMSGATLDVFDAQHCMGRTTGLLNNLFVANTKRRAGMTIAPPADTKAYLEVRVSPGRELFLVTNSVATGVVCGSAFNLTPQPGAEYEVTFKRSGNHCVTAVSSLNQVGGEVARIPMPVFRQGLASCEGSNPLFPKPAQGKPDAPQRAAMIDQIIDDSLIDAMQPDSKVENSLLLALAEQQVIDDRKQLMNFTLPQAYWEEFRRNLELAADESASRKARILQRYKDEYRLRLRQLDTEYLRKRVPDGDATDVRLTLGDNMAMMRYYNELSNDILKQDMSAHIARMADLDRRYDVCSRFAKCWKN